VKLHINILSVDYYIALPLISDTGDYYSFTFENKLVSWLGLAQRDYQSGNITYEGGIIKEGTPWLRWALVHTVRSAVPRDDHFRTKYQRNDEEVGRQY
jgi:transposase